VKLNVDKDHQTHKTCVGGIASLVYFVIFLWMFIQCLGNDVEAIEQQIDKNLIRTNPPPPPPNVAPAEPSTRRRELASSGTTIYTH